MKRSVANNFWSWFTQSEQTLRCVSGAQDSVLEELSDALQMVDPDLTFELLPQSQGLSELIISANGVRELVPMVDALVDAKPELENWKITALRQRRELKGASLQCGDMTLYAEQVGFSLSLELRRVDITLYLDNCSPDEYYRWLETVFLLLDAAIGERDVALHVGEVFIKERSDESATQVHPFIELPERFDQFLIEAKKEVRELDSMETTSRRTKISNELKQKATALAEQLQEESSELEAIATAPLLVSVEVHFRQEDERTAAALVSQLEQTRTAVAEQIDFGGVLEQTHWVHAWFDIPYEQLDSIEALIDELAQEGYHYNCELEAVFLSWAEESASISSILGNLDTLADAHAVLEAHQELDHGNPARAVELLEEALEDDLENLEVRALLAYAYAKLRDKEMAEACLDELRDDVGGNSEHPTLFWNIACAYALLAEAQSACDNLRLAFALDPELRELAIKDPDLSNLRGQPEFDELMFQA